MMALFGIVAIETIPAMVTDFNKKVYATQFKKTYNLLNYAFYRIKSDVCNDTFKNCFNDENHAETGDDVINALGNYIKYREKCLTGDDSCFHTDIWNLSKSDTVVIDEPKYKELVMHDGTVVSVHTTSQKDCSTTYFTRNGEGSTCAFIYVDVNGVNSGPNVSGRDIFQLLLAKDGLYPEGSQGSEESDWDTYCSMSSSHQWNGDACAARIIQEGKMNY